MCTLAWATHFILQKPRVHQQALNTSNHRDSMTTICSAKMHSYTAWLETSNSTFCRR